MTTPLRMTSIRVGFADDTPLRMTSIRMGFVDDTPLRMTSIRMGLTDETPLSRIEWKSFPAFLEWRRASRVRGCVLLRGGGGGRP